MQNTDKNQSSKAAESNLRFSIKRTFWLAIAAVGGVLLAKYANNMLQEILGFMPKNSDDANTQVKLVEFNIGSIQLAIFLMSLPVLYVLWRFRTDDTQNQIKKAQGNVDKAQGNLNANLLGLYLKMLLSQNLEERCIGLIRLAALKQQGVFTKEIDSATRRRLDLNEAELRGENLSGVNLEGAKLNKANLQSADTRGANLRYAKMQEAVLRDANLQMANLERAELKGADMRGADLRGADLQGADLENADLRGADLSSAENLGTANLTDAKYDDKLAKFPDNFSPSRAGMKLEPADSNGNSA